MNRFMKLLFVFIGFSMLNTIYAQDFQKVRNGESPEAPREVSVQDIKVSIYTTTLDVCNGKKHVYIGTDFDKEALRSSGVKTIEVTQIDDPSSVKLIDIGVERERRIEFDFFNQVSKEGLLEYVLKGKAPNGTLVFKKSIVIDTEARTDDEIIDVSPHLAKMLENHKEANVSLVTYFCGKQISQVELLSFFKEYLELTTEQICNLIEMHNSVIGNHSFTNPSSQYIALNDYLCTIYDGWLVYVRKLNTVVVGDKCKCKMIRTKSSAISIGTGIQSWENNDPSFVGDETQDCTNYEGKINAKNYDNQDGDSDMIYSYGRLGAALAGTVELMTDGNDDMDSPFIKDMAEGYSTLSFQSVCDPITQAVLWDSCSCNKEVNVAYGYYSNYTLFAQTWANWFQEESSDIKVDDWVVIMAENGDETTSLAIEAGSHQIKCEAEEDSAVDHIIENGEDIVDKIKKAVTKGTSIGAVLEAAEPFY